jgi:hypothetical protein
MKEMRGLGSIRSRRARDVFCSGRSLLQWGKEVQLHAREHGEGGIDRVCQVFDRLGSGPRLGAHFATSQLSQ